MIYIVDKAAKDFKFSKNRFEFSPIGATSQSEYGIACEPLTLTFLHCSLSHSHLYQLMFDFENLEVYKKAKAFNSIVSKMIIVGGSLDSTTKNQLSRAVLALF